MARSSKTTYTRCNSDFDAAANNAKIASALASYDSDSKDVARKQGLIASLNEKTRYQTKLLAAAHNHLDVLYNEAKIEDDSADVSNGPISELLQNVDQVSSLIESLLDRIQSL